jgi:polyisoprenoid-binding protein YceI
VPSVPPLLRRGRTWLIGIPIAVFLVAVVAPYVYIHFIEGPPPAKLTLNDATVTSTTSTTTSGGVTATSDASFAGSSSAGSSGSIAGAWKVTSGSQAGYRVQETLFGQGNTAVGRTTHVSGTMTIAGTTVSAANVVVDMTTVSSDRSQRDDQFRNRIMSTDQFPSATFKLTRPIDLGTLPADGQQKTYSAIGDLTLRGVTKSVTVSLIAERKSGEILVNSDIKVSFDDFNIPDASGGPASVGRTGDIELLVAFAR